MDATTLLLNLLSTQAPALPEPAVARAYLALGWGLVLACTGLWAARRMHLGRAGCWALPMALLAWSLWPGPASPSYWLGLAFRSPSLTSVLLCGWWLLAPQWQARSRSGGLFRLPPLVSMGGIVLGWLLLLDTFAVWPFSLYELGFSPAALGGMALLGALPWLLAGDRSDATAALWLVMVVLLVYGLLRLPSGNLWDALLDPWLWLMLQSGWLLRCWRSLRRRA